MEQKLTIKKEDSGLTTVLVEGGPQLSPDEKERIKKDWERPENKAKLEKLLEQHGYFKKVIDQKTGIAYKVPTRIIITEGLNYADLPKYPLWKE